MAISVLLASPQNNSISVPIDTSIQLTFSKPVDKFTILNGITIYSIGAQTWTGSLLSSKDALTSDVKSDAGQIDVVEFSAITSGANVTVFPSAKLSQNTQYYIQISPGEDISRFVSAQTTDSPIYSVGASGEINITSAYSGNISGIYTVSFTSGTEFDVLLDGIYKNSYTFTENVPLEIEDVLSISITSGFAIGDTATINVYPAEGLSGICKVLFTTSQYETSAPKSISIEDKLYGSTLNELKVINTIPAPFSVNNQSINPIVIKFNRNISNLQDILDKVKVHKVNLENGDIKKIQYVPELNGNILKLYLQSVLQMSEINENSIYDLYVDKSSKIDALNYIV